MGLMLVFIMTLLGAALFNVAQLDARLKLDSQTGVQALEIAEAGLERGLHLFYLEFICGGPNGTASPITLANCANPPTDPNYITENALARIALTTDCPAALLPDGATGFHVLGLDQAFAGGTYTVCVRQWPDPNSDPPNQPSSDQQKAQFRSRGVLSSVTGTVQRIVQIDATAAVTASKPHAPFSIGGPTSGAIKGNAVIAGPVQFLSCPGAGCVAVEFGGGGGLQNNYTQLDSNLKSRIPMLFPNGTPVSTLGAVLKVKEGLVKLSSGSACIGKQETGSGCGGGANAGIQDTMSGVYSSGTWGGTNGDCAAGLNGQTTLNKRCNVWTEAQGPYPASDLSVGPPLLSDSTIIDGKGYRCFFYPPDLPDSPCPNDPAHAPPIPGGTNFNEYFYTSAWRIDDSRGAVGCDIVNPVSGGSSADTCATVLNALQTGVPPDFGAGPVTAPLQIQPSACVRQGASDPNSCTLQIGASGSPLLNGRIIALIDGAPIRGDSAQPINVYVHRLGSAPSTTPTMTTSPVDAITDKNMYYRGQIIILADNPAGTPGFAIANGLLSETTINQPWCSLGSYLCGYAYPANHFLAMLTTGDITTGTGGTKQILGTFFAANSALTAKFAITGGVGQTQFAGTFSAQQFDFTGASQPPKLYLAPWNLNALPQAFGAGGSSFAAIIASNWRQIQ